MQTMYSSLSKTSQAFSFAAIRVSASKPRCVITTSSQLYTPITQSLPPTGSHPKPSKNPFCVQFSTSPRGFFQKSCKVSNFVGMGSVSRVAVRIRVRRRGGGWCCYVVRSSGFSSCSYSERIGERSGVGRGEKALPWLSSSEVKEVKRVDKWKSGKSNRSSWEESVKRLDEGSVAKNAGSSWEGLVEADFSKKSNGNVADEESRNRMVSSVKDKGNSYVYDGRDDGVEGKEEELEVIDDPRWDKIQSRLGGMMGVKDRTAKPEFQRWNKQETWGRKTWKEANESTVPKMVGEGVYGVGPVLAALSAGRREFYAMYVQEGLDLSGNNKKKKDKKGFERLLRIAKNIGLNVKEVSKHDLNMVVDNRPHQGIVLDASPLEMVKIMELDPVSSDEEKRSLWVALDEVMDPQNLGAIIRSAYFFGATGVVLCAKNSAPLSGVVSKASAGSLEVMELRYCKNMMQFLVSSADNGWRVLGGSVSSKAVPLNEVLPGEPTILVLGSEGTGLRPLVERSCTQLVRIPGRIPEAVTLEGGNDVEADRANPEFSRKEFQSFLAVESLNVSVAAGVLLHHLAAKKDNDDQKISDNSCT